MAESWNQPQNLRFLTLGPHHQSPQIGQLQSDSCQSVGWRDTFNCDFEKTHDFAWMILDVWNPSCNASSHQSRINSFAQKPGPQTRSMSLPGVPLKTCRARFKLDGNRKQLKHVQFEFEKSSRKYSWIEGFCWYWCCMHCKLCKLFTGSQDLPWRVIWVICL